MYQKQTPLLSSFAFPFRNLIAHRSELTDNHRWSFSFTKLGLLRSFSVRWESFRVYFSFLISFSDLGYFIIAESSVLSPSTLFASHLSDTIRCHCFPRCLPRYSSHPVTPLPLSPKLPISPVIHLRSFPFLAAAALPCHVLYSCACTSGLVQWIRYDHVCLSWSYLTREPAVRSMPVSGFVSKSNGPRCSPHHARHASPTICVL